MGFCRYIVRPSRFGDFAVVWQETDVGPKVCRVILPRQDSATVDLVRADFNNAVPGTCPVISELGDRMQAFLESEPIGFDIGIVERGRCSSFQKHVLFAEYKVPRGWVSTYGKIAHYLGVPKASRAVGNALANNPFPIIIPCHRAIQSDGGLGGFQGGSAMKRKLLEMEGVEFSRSGKVITERIYY